MVIFTVTGIGRGWQFFRLPQTGERDGAFRRFHAFKSVSVKWPRLDPSVFSVPFIGDVWGKQNARCRGVVARLGVLPGASGGLLWKLDWIGPGADRAGLVLCS